MRRFELWLDESGDFTNDQRKVERNENPSLVGGLLIENNTFADQEISMILPEEGTYHSVDMNDQLVRFRKIDERLQRNPANKLVVFSNRECIMILDNNITYLNIISQGILQILKYLNARYGDVFLRVIIANRVDTTTGEDPTVSVVKNREYVKRLREKLLIEGLQESITEEEWELQNASARSDKRLMLADIVCNTFFTRYRKNKFTAGEREYIESVYTNRDKTLTFSVFESVLEKEFTDSLLDNKVGEAVSRICLSDDKEMVRRCFDLLKKRFDGQGLNNVRFQYNFINAYIEYYINVVRDYNLIVRFLNNLLEYYVPLLAEQREAARSRLDDRLRLNIKFYLWTAYARLGDVANSERMQRECEAELPRFPSSLYTISNRIKFGTRKIITLCNAFKYEEALEFSNEHVQKCREVDELLTLISGDESTHFDALAGALAARTQVIAFLLRGKPELYDEGVLNSEEAIAEFVEYRDKKRQYLYRVLLETEAGNYDKAYEYLCKAVGTGETPAEDPEGESGVTGALEAGREAMGDEEPEDGGDVPAEMRAVFPADSRVDLPADADAREVWALAEKESPYEAYMFIRLMAESAESWGKAEEMFKALSGSEYIKKLMNKETLYHPEGVTLWKYAGYCARKGMKGAAASAYEKAEKACFAQWPDLTLNVIGMGIYFEHMSFLLKGGSSEAKELRKKMIKSWKSIEKEKGAEMLARVFGEVNLDSSSVDYFRMLSRKMTH